MRNSWKTKTKVPKIADWSVDCGETWLIFEVFDHVVPRRLLGGNASTDELDQELYKLVHQRKGAQLASTENLIATSLAKLTGSSKSIDRKKIFKFVVLPNEGLAWTPPVSRRLEQLSADYPGSSTSLAFITARELNMLESASESGLDPALLLSTWQLNRSDSALDRHLELSGIPLRPSRWQFGSANSLLGDFGFSEIEIF